MVSHRNNGLREGQPTSIVKRSQCQFHFFQTDEQNYSINRVDLLCVNAPSEKS